VDGRVVYSEVVCGDLTGIKAPTGIGTPHKQNSNKNN
jgi:hypothetical protein